LFCNLKKAIDQLGQSTERCPPDIPEELAGQGIWRLSELRQYSVGYAERAENSAAPGRVMTPRVFQLHLKGFLL